MRARAAVAALLALGACGPAITERPAPGASAPASRHSRFHRFRVEAVAAPTQIRHELALKEISRLPGAAGSGLKTQGLTTIKHSMATHTRFSTATNSSAVYAWYDDVILEVSVSSIVIHIPSEYAPGSCEYEIVLEHERGHGRAAREQAVEFAGKLERALMVSENIPTRFDPVIAPDIAAAAEQLKIAIDKVVNPVYERYEADEKEAQAKLDRPDPYDQVYRKCSNWR